MLNAIYHHSMEPSNHSKDHRSNRSSPALFTHNGTHQQLNNNHNYHHSMEPSNHSKHHRSNRSSPALFMHNGTHQQLNNNHNYHQTPIPTPVPSLSSIQCSAYFICRVDLNNYTLETLKQTVDSVVSGPRSKGLKVKLSLPDEGLIIDNTPDPNQSWMYKTSELLYFWRDSYYINTIVVITINRSRYQTTSGSYSASVFRLRGHESVQLFLQRAQQFFAQLSTPTIPKNKTKVLLEKSVTTENVVIENHNKNHQKRSADQTRPPKRSVMQPLPPTQTTTAPRVIRTEFDPEKMMTTDSIFDLYNRRTFSETTLSSDTRTSNSKKQNNRSYDEDDDKMTTASNYLPGEYVAELMHELKELRSEIAALKLDTRFTPVRSTSTSPLVASQDNSYKRLYSSSSEIDAETQTDFSLIDNETINGTFVTNKRKNEQLNTNVNKRTMTNGSHREETTLVNSSQMNGSSNGISSSSNIQEGFQPMSYPFTPRSILKPYQNGSIISNSNFHNKSSSSIPMDTESSFPIKTGEVVSFRSSIEDNIASPENIYENIPIVSQTNSNRKFFHNGNDQQNGKPHLYVTIAGNQNSDLQKQYLSQLFGPQNGISLLIPPVSLSNNYSSTIPEPTLNGQQYFQQVLYSDHLTNPLFNVDKQLLKNTIANQFGIDVNSPYLQKLIANQHLFVRHKRTFANMIWPITLEEEHALCSSPVSTTNIIDIKTVDWNSSTARSILKSKTSSRSVSKGQHISWDSALE